VINLFLYIVVVAIICAIGLLPLYFVIRAAVRSAMRSHALWLASDRYAADVVEYKRTAARYGES
jgi:hypothetical protein